MSGMRRASSQGSGSNMECQSPRKVRRSPSGGSTAQGEVRETEYDEEDDHEEEPVWGVGAWVSWGQHVLW